MAVSGVSAIVKVSGQGTLRGRRAFTLLEVLLAIGIAAIMMMLAVPSIVGFKRQERLDKSINDFNGFIQGIRTKAITQRRDYLLIWNKNEITAISQDAERDSQAVDPEVYTVPAGKMTLTRHKALIKDPPLEWMFWRSGACEPVVITYDGPEGHWKAEYSALTANGKILTESTE